MVTREQDALVLAAAAKQSRPSLGAIWAALADVSDPEIPVVSILDLGMVREVAWDLADPSVLVVRVTPTYSGCPATDVIFANVRDALARAGVSAVRVETALSPAWSTAWMTVEGERKLRAYGIAPPGSARTSDRAPRTAVVDLRGLRPLRRPSLVVPCPRCGSSNTELVAPFGSTACKAQYRCTECGEPFDYFKTLA